jgi:hypothetical protein
MMLELTAEGNLRTSTLRAFDHDQMQAIIRRTGCERENEHPPRLGVGVLSGAPALLLALFTKLPEVFATMSATALVGSVEQGGVCYE